MEKEITKQGFTLIELLVVVLIIGILAAIAIPQYRFVILKSRASEAFIKAKAIKESMELYRLMTGSNTPSFSDLDITFPEIVSYQNNYAGKAMYWDYSLRGSNTPEGSGTAFGVCIRSVMGVKPQSVSYEICFINDAIQCLADKDSYMANKICKSLGGSVLYNTDVWTCYKL
jgi:prepilin-type N-terminal cleavage/methylation domain-containing protein